MCRPAILAISLAAGLAPAAAKPRAPVATPAPVETDFWREVIEPHGDEVRALVQKARTAMKMVDDQLAQDSEWAVDQRMRYFHDAYGLMRYARTLSPANIDVLVTLGRAADEVGKTRVAIDALETAARLLGPDKITPEVAGRLGAIHLRRGDGDAAIRYLRHANTGGAVRAETAQPLVHLANALAARGDVSAAVDALSNAMPSTFPGYVPQELLLLSFALAVIYDRDEQKSAAFEILDKMKSTLSTNFGPQVQTVLAGMRFAPSEDQSYYLGLLYEVQGQYVEARAQFATYAATGDATWRARALEHVHAIDAERRAPRKPAAGPLQLQLTPYRRHHP